MGINMTSLDDIFLEVTSGGETRRLGTGETAAALAGRDDEGHLMYDPLEHNGWENPRKEEDRAKYKRPGSLSTTSNVSHEPPDTLQDQPEPTKDSPDPLEQGTGGAVD